MTNFSDFGSPTGSLDSDLQVRVYYLTHQGVPQQAIISSTQSNGSFAPKQELLRQAVEAYFAVMGGTVLSVQLEIVSPSRFSPELTSQAKVIQFPTGGRASKQGGFVNWKAGVGAAGAALLALAMGGD